MFSNREADDSAKSTKNRPTSPLDPRSSALKILLLLLACLLSPLALALHPANVASAGIKVAPDGTLTARIRFDLTAFVTGLPPREAQDDEMNAFLDATDDAMRTALADAEARFRREFAFGGAIDRLAFPTVAGVRAYLASDPKPRLPLMLVATVEGHLPSGTRTIAFRYPNALGAVIQTVEFPYSEPISEPVEPGRPSAPLTIPTPEEVAKLAAAIAAPRKPSVQEAVPLAAAGPRPDSSRPNAANGKRNRKGGGVDKRVLAHESEISPTRSKPKPWTAGTASEREGDGQAAPIASNERRGAPAKVAKPNPQISPNKTQTSDDEPQTTLVTPTPPNPSSLTPAPSPPSSQILTYLRMGFTHILPEGLDHILFVLGLFLLGSNTKALLKQITAFTVAHSLTLALATLNVVHLPARIIEPLIAFSIAFVAVENLTAKEPNRWRTLVVFGFGLVHGLGFAEVFRDAGLSGRSLLTALVSFNFGVEAGQLAVVALALLAVGWFRSDPRYRRVVVLPASAAIALVALFWTAQRIIA